MTEWLLSLLGEDVLVMYVSYRFKHLLPLFAALLYIYTHVHTTIKVARIWQVNTQQPVVHQYAAVWIASILRWRVRNLSRVIDNEDALPIY